MNFIPMGLNEKFGYINAQGEIMIPLKFEEAGNFAANGLAAVAENGKRSYINADGQIVVFIDEACDFEVLKNARGEIIWPLSCPGLWKFPISSDSATDANVRSAFGAVP